MNPYGTHAEMVVPADHQSIFSDTYHGVPSPAIPHTHPYPTRFHGPIYSYPRFYHTYRKGSWNVPTGYVGAASPKLAVSGLGDTPALFGSATGSTLIDALVGAGIGYAMAPDSKDRMLWTGAGAAAALLAGTLGLVGIVGAGFYVRRR